MKERDYAGDYGIEEQLRWFSHRAWVAWVAFLLLLSSAYSLLFHDYRTTLLMLLPVVLWKLYGAIYWSYCFWEASTSARRNEACNQSDKA
jgi:hypothetical protein